MKSKTVTLESGQKVTVKKLPLGRYAKLIKAIQDLPKHQKKLESLENETVLEALPELIAEGLPDVIRILAIATPLKKEEIEELGLDEAVDLAMAVFEVNNYQKVYDRIKKALARPDQVEN
jgi:hypothetical protein